jgi:hypothetical protein
LKTRRYQQTPHETNGWHKSALFLSRGADERKKKKKKKKRR